MGNFIKEVCVTIDAICIFFIISVSLSVSFVSAQTVGGDGGLDLIHYILGVLVAAVAAMWKYSNGGTSRTIENLRNERKAIIEEKKHAQQEVRDMRERLITKLENVTNHKILNGTGDRMVEQVHEIHRKMMTPKPKAVPVQRMRKLYRKQAYQLSEQEFDNIKSELKYDNDGKAYKMVTQDEFNHSTTY